jgi:hypothetical protein
VAAEWQFPGGALALSEQTRFLFQGGDTERIIDRITTLTAPDARIRLSDNKEGLLGLRVARALELPAGEAAVLVGADGKPGAKPVTDDTGVTGRYLSSEGKEGAAVWGTRARWVRLSGTIDDKPVSVVIFDHSANPGHPTYWHARPYGLFAANPLGWKAFTDGKQTLDFALPARRSVTFRYRILITNDVPPPAVLDRRYAEAVKELDEK